MSLGEIEFKFPPGIPSIIIRGEEPALSVLIPRIWSDISALGSLPPERDIANPGILPCTICNGEEVVITEEKSSFLILATALVTSVFRCTP